MNRKRVRRLMREAGLLVPVSRRPRPGHDGAFRRPEGPNRLWQIDLTKIWCGPDGWAALIGIVDVFDRTLVGWTLSPRARTVEALEALEQAIARWCPQGTRGLGLVLGKDNGPQFTSRAFLRALDTLGITPQATHYRAPEENAFIESFFGRLKDEEVWLNEYESLHEAQQAIGTWIDEYNRHRPHSALGYRAPLEVRRQHDALHNQAA